MHLPAPIRLGVACVLGLLTLCPPALALVSIDDGKNQFFVNATVSYAYDSNIFANANGGGDSIYTASVGAEFKRRAGLIGVNGSVYLDASKFVQNTGENFQNPRFRVEFTKQTGRTTGALTLGAARESRADTAANLRNESWSYDAGLNFKYPVIERYTISGTVGYALRDFKDNRVLVDLSTYTASADLFYVYNTERDIIGGYRLRYSETSADSAFYDHAFTVGLSGKILPKLGGSVRVGYQFRVPTNRADESFSSMTASGSATWNLSKRMNATFQISKDFSITSTNISTDTTAGNVDFQYTMSTHLALYAGAGAGLNDFLGTAGGGRHDTYFTWSTGAGYTLNDHLKFAFTYAYFRNRSTAAFSDFERSSFTLNATAIF